MKFKELEEKIKEKIQQDLELKASKVLQERLQELNDARRRVTQLEKSYNELLETNLEDIVILNNDKNNGVSLSFGGGLILN